MNHKRVYNDIIKRGKERELSHPLRAPYYSENHHILPGCLGGDDSPENLVRLTAREHFICHALLCYIYPKHHGLLFAFISMCGNKKINSNKYRKLREDHSIVQSNFMLGNTYSLGNNWNMPQAGKDLISKRLIGNTYLKDSEYFKSGRNRQTHLGNTWSVGEKSGMAKLKADQVIKIWYDTRLKYHDIAAEYDVSFSAIFKIKNRETWRHITNDLPSTFEEYLRNYHVKSQSITETSSTYQ